MAKNLYILATEGKSGKSTVALGMMQLLQEKLKKIAFFRPVISPSGSGRDSRIELIRKHFSLDIAYEDSYVYTLQAVRNMMNRGEHEAILENILNRYKQLEAEYDFVLCEGTDFLGNDPAFEFNLNCAIASNIGCPVLLVANAAGKTSGELDESTQLILDQLDEKSLDVVSCVVNRSSLQKTEEEGLAALLHSKSRHPLAVYFIPEERALGNPTVSDVQKWLTAHVVYGQKHLEGHVDNYLIAAMQVGNVLEHIRQGCMIITPGDRSDVVLGAFASRVSSACPDIAGVILTGGLPLSAAMQRLLGGWTEMPVPILSVRENTYETVQRLSLLQGRIEPDDERKIHTALGLFASNVDTEQIAGRIGDLHSVKITPKMFECNLIQRAASERMRIVLPEGTDERVLRAADILQRRKVADILLLGNTAEVQAKIARLGLEMDVPIIQPDTAKEYEDYARAYFELRKAKGATLEFARDIMLDPSFFGTMMVYKGDADGMVSGAINTTAHTIRPSFEFVKTKPGVSIVSSVFLMCLKDRVLVFGDCAVNPNPTAANLADIAINSARTARIFGIEPRVAMLSYSTGSSGKGSDVDVVIEATKLAREKAPELPIEGPLQYDAAIDPEVARIKMPNSDVAGKATVFIFPDLNTGNNTYKAVQRAAGAVAIGPVLQGLNKPVNDLSRGCTVADIVNTVAITAIQAQAEKR